jgi:hypothetical protein
VSSPLEPFIESFISSEHWATTVMDEEAQTAGPGVE